MHICLFVYTLFLMDPQDPNTPTQPDVDHSNPFDQFYNDEGTEKQPVDQEIPGDIQATLNELAPQVPSDPAQNAGVPEIPGETSMAPLPTEANFPEAGIPEMATETDEFSSDPVPQPQAPVAQNNFVAKPHIRINGKGIIIGLVLFLLMTVAGTVGVLAATGNLDFPFLQPIMIQIQKLPFIKKTPEYVISQALAASTKVDSYHYDLSASVNVASQQFGLGGGDTQFDIKTTGDATFTADGTPDKVQGNFAFRSDMLELNGVLSVNYLSADEMFYIQMESVTGTFGTFSSYLPPTGTWYSFDMSALDSQARTALEATISPTMAEEQVYGYFTDVMERLFETDQLKDEVTLTGVEKMSDNTDAYHLKMVPSVDTMLEFVKAFAEYNDEAIDAEDFAILRDTLQDFKVFTIDIWVDEDNFMLRKFQLVVSYAYDAQEFLPALPIVFNPEGPVVAGVSKVLSEAEVQQDTIDLSIVTEFSNINQTPVITIPTEHTPIEEYLQSAFGQFDSGFSQTDIRNSDIKSTIGYVGMAFEAYFTENNGVYPSTLSELVSDEQLFTIPTPPAERAGLGCTVTTEYAHAQSENESAVWADLEPCVGGETQEWYVYWTACGRTSTITGTPPNEMDIAIGKGC